MSEKYLVLSGKLQGMYMDEHEAAVWLDELESIDEHIDNLIKEMRIEASNVRNCKFSKYAYISSLKRRALELKTSLVHKKYLGATHVAVDNEYVKCFYVKEL